VEVCLELLIALDRLPALLDGVVQLPLRQRDIAEKQVSAGIFGILGQDRFSLLPGLRPVSGEKVEPSQLVPGLQHLGVDLDGF